MVGVELSGHAAERLSLRLLRTLVEELSEELKRGSFQSQCCETIFSLSGSLSAAASEARQPPAASPDARQVSWPQRSADSKELNLLDELRDDSPRGQQGLLSAFRELDDASKCAVPTDALRVSIVSSQVSKVASQDDGVPILYEVASQDDGVQSRRSSEMKLPSPTTLSRRVTSQDDGTPCRSSSEKDRASTTWSGFNSQSKKKASKEFKDCRNSLEYQETLNRMFEELDQDHSGSLGAEELRAALVAAGIPKARTQKILFAADTDGNGEIDVNEWKAAVIAEGHLDLKALNNSLSSMSSDQRGSLLQQDLNNEAERMSPCMLRPDSNWRLMWDFSLAVLCIYVALVLPFTSGFSHWIQHDVLIVVERFELAIDVFFLVDVCLNFRTGIMHLDGSVLLDSRRVALSYLTSCFALDLCSSIPFSEMTSGSVVSVRVLKLLKIPKLLKAVRVIKSMLMGENQLIIILQETFSTRLVRTMGRRLTMLVMTVLLCHWLACLMAFTSTAWLSDYLARSNQVEQLFSIYLGAIYWAMTTMTTVGWGDITPTSNVERGYVIVAMVLGGAYYGYAVGILTSIISNRDLNATAYHDRMEAIYAWLDHHRLPNEVRRRVIRYFKLYLSAKAAIRESDVVNDMSPSLRNEVGTLIIHADILFNPVFDGVPMNAVTRLQPIIETIYMEEGSLVVQAGQTGMAMFFIHEGIATQEFVVKNGVIRPRVLAAGDSFGEEILCSLAHTYCYNVTVTAKRASMFTIEEVCFKTIYEHMPDVIAQVVKNASELQHVVWDS